MKTKKTKETNKTLVQQMRAIRDKVNFDIKDLSLEQLKEYINKQETLHKTAIWQR